LDFGAIPAATYNNIEGWLRFDPVNFIKWYALDYRSRPHSVHNTFSPNEVYAGTDTHYQTIFKRL
jgi:hypothetical protein